MKLIIDIPEEVYKKAKETHDVMCDSVWLGIKNGTPLEKHDTTNGDVIKAMFPDGQIFNEETTCVTVKFNGDEYVDFYTDWWNAPYKAESKDKHCDRNVCASNEYNGIGCDECIYNPTESEDKNE